MRDLYSQTDTLDTVSGGYRVSLRSATELDRTRSLHPFGELRPSQDSPHGLILLQDDSDLQSFRILQAIAAAVTDPQGRVLLMEESEPCEAVGKPGDTLRKFLVYDPDTVVVSEIGTQDLAERCFEAAMCGHLIVSKVRASEPDGVVERLRGFGISRLFISQALRAIVSQETRVEPRMNREDG